MNKTETDMEKKKMNTDKELREKMLKANSLEEMKSLLNGQIPE